MSIIDDVNKLAEKEREIRGIQRLIAVVSALSDEDLAKAWPRITVASQKALRRSFPHQENNPIATQATSTIRRSDGELEKTIPEQNDVPYYISPPRENTLWPGLRPLQRAMKPQGKGRLTFCLLVLTAPALLFSGSWQLVTYLPYMNSTAATEHAIERRAVNAAQPINKEAEKNQVAESAELGNSVVESAAALGSHTDPAAQPVPFLERKNERTPPPVKQLNNRIPSFVVTAASFVRAKPSSKAAILATLEPGTKIKVAGRTGEYFRVRVIEPQQLSGFIHKQDAFFERRG
jgi:hypothetical protein